MTLRPFDPETDFPGVVEIHNANYPFNLRSVERARFGWSTLDTQRYHRERQVAVEPGTGRVVGMAQFGHDPEMFHPDKYGCAIHVHPEYQGRGLGRQLWTWLDDRLRDRGAIVARGNVWEDHSRAVAFAARRGFAEKRRVWQSALAASQVDLAALAFRAERVQAQGITQTTLAAELAREPQCLQKLYALASESLRHMPLPDMPTDPPFEMFRQWVMENPHRLPEAFFIAQDGERYVGLSFLEKADEADALNQGLTATDPAYMGRGIAWALKLRTVKYAQDHAYRRIKTWNDAENKPMLSINLRLGFTPLPAWITVEREFAR